MNKFINLAEIILNGYEDMMSEFMNVTLGAQERFEKARWHDVHAAMRLRLTVYKQKVINVEKECRKSCEFNLSDPKNWQDIKINYANMIVDHPNALIAESFFNSVFNRLFGHMAIRSNNIFTGVKIENSHQALNNADDILIDFAYRDNLKDTVKSILIIFLSLFPMKILIEI